jgi:hypothetical protein
MTTVDAFDTVTTDSKAIPTVIYRCFGLTKDNRILWGRHVEAENVACAFIACTEIMPDATASIEIWLEARKVYPRPPPSSSRSKR